MDPRDRRRLADRAADVWKEGGLSYGEAVDVALAEQNPAADAATGEKLLYTLLNVSDPAPEKNRLRAGREDDWPDMVA